MSSESILEQTDRELEEYRKALKLVSKRGRVAIWDQIDRLLERRLTVAGAAPAGGVNVDPQ